MPASATAGAPGAGAATGGAASVASLASATTSKVLATASLSIPSSSSSSSSTSSSSSNSSSSRRLSPLRISNSSITRNGTGVRPSLSRSSSSSSSSTTSRRSSHTATPLAYPDASDKLVLERRELPVLVRSASNSTATSPTTTRRKSSWGREDESSMDGIRAAGDLFDGTGSSLSSRGYANGLGDGTGRGGSAGGNDGLLDLEAELASAVSEESFFSAKPSQPSSPQQSASQAKNRSPSLTTITTRSSSAAADAIANGADGQRRRAEDGEAVRPWPPSFRHKYSGGAATATDETASASADSTTGSTSSTGASLSGMDESASLPSTASTRFSLDSPVHYGSSAQAAVVKGDKDVEHSRLTPSSPSSTSTTKRGPSSLLPSFFVQNADEDHSMAAAATTGHDDDGAAGGGGDDGPSPTPSPFPSPPRGIPSLPPRLDISDFGIYSAAPSPAPSPVSTPPSQTRPLPTRFHPHYQYPSSLNSSPARLSASSNVVAGNNNLHIPDHLPPLNLPQTPLSLPADLPEITLTSPAAMADLAPLSLEGGGGGGGGGGAKASVHRVLLSPTQVQPPHMGRRHTDPGTILGVEEEAAAAESSSVLLPAPEGLDSSRGQAASGDASNLVEGLRILPPTHSAPTAGASSFWGLNGKEEAAELDRRLRLLASLGGEGGRSAEAEAKAVAAGEGQAERKAGNGGDDSKRVAAAADVEEVYGATPLSRSIHLEQESIKADVQV